MMTKECGATNESVNSTRPNMVMDEKWAKNEAFIAKVVTIGRSKESNGSEVSISRH